MPVSILMWTSACTPSSWATPFKTAASFWLETVKIAPSCSSCRSSSCSLVGRSIRIEASEKPPARRRLTSLTSVTAKCVTPASRQMAAIGKSPSP